MDGRMKCEMGGQAQGECTQFQLVTSADLERFRLELLKEIRYLLSQKTKIQNKQWMRLHEVRKLLQISPGTLQHLRDTGQLPFTKLGGIIYYDLNSTNALINK